MPKAGFAAAPGQQALRDESFRDGATQNCSGKRQRLENVPPALNLRLRQAHWTDEQ
jgi:hypothetical protein